MSSHSEVHIHPADYHITEINDILCIGENRRPFLRIVKHIIEVDKLQAPVNSLRRPTGFDFLSCTILTRGSLVMPDQVDTSSQVDYLQTPMQPGTQQNVEYLFTLPSGTHRRATTKRFWHPEPTEPIPKLTVAVRFAPNLIPYDAYEREGSSFFNHGENTATKKVNSTEEIMPQLINPDSDGLKIEAEFLNVAVGEIRGLTWKAKPRSSENLDKTAAGVEGTLGSAQIARIVSAYQNGASAERVAIENGISKNAVRRLWRKHGPNEPRVQP